MLNPELQKDINLEITKAEPLIQEFLTRDYFRETMDLVFKVNRLNEIQKESVELETILYILNLSNYENIGEAIKAECSIETTNTVKQLSDDLEKYIFEKLKITKTKIVDSELEEETKKLEVLNTKNKEARVLESEINNNPIKTEEVLGVVNVGNINLAEDKSMAAAGLRVKNLLDENFDIKNPRDLVKNIITPENKNTVPSNITLEINSNSKENMKESIEKIDTKLGDVYRERVDLSEEVINKET